MRKILLELPKRKRVLFTDSSPATVVRLYSDGRAEAVEAGPKVYITRDYGSFNVVYGVNDFSAGEPIKGLADLYVVDDISQANENPVLMTYGISIAHSFNEIAIAWSDYVVRQQQEIIELNRRIHASLQDTIEKLKG